MKSLSVKQKLTFATALVVLVLLSIFSVLNYSQAKNRIVSNVNADITQIGQSLSGFVSDWIGTKHSILASASLFSSNRNNHDQILEQGQKAGDFLYMYIGSDKGEMIMIPKEDLPDDYDPRTRPWYKQALNENAPILTAPYVDASSGGLVLSFARPTSIGVIAADIGMNVVATEVLNINFGETGRAMMTDSAGTILIHEDETFFEQTLDSVISEGTVTESVSEITMGDKTLLAASFPVTGTPWSIVVTVEKGDALSELNQLTLNSWIMTIIILVAVIFAVSLLMNLLLNPLKDVTTALKDISSGDADLTQRLEIRSDDEIGQLSEYFNNFIESIHRMVIDVIDSAAQLDELSKQSHSTATGNNNAIQNQQAEITQVAAAIHEMSSTSAIVADNAKITADSAENAQGESELSEKNATENRQRMSGLTDQIDETTSVINQLNDHAQQINTILATIQGIAEQTNLLALNAAIEAARAGDQGRGFAVVADEVRALSQRTHEATGEIQSMIEALSSQTSSAVVQMEKSKSLVEDTMTTAQAVSTSQIAIRDAILNINQQAITISEASREQNSATEEINKITQAIQDESQQLSENVESAYVLSEQMNELGQHVQNHLERFRT
jgi:methyl-accepting chemotaxis protein